MSRTQSTSFTQDQLNRMLELVEKDGRVYGGMKNFSQESGISIFICRNAWYRNNMSKLLSKNFKSKNRRVNTNEEALNLNKGVLFSEAKNVIDTILNEYDRMKSILFKALEENESLKEINESLKLRLSESDKFKNEYNDLLAIINKARISHIDESLGISSTDRRKIHMEQNGNLISQQ